MSEERRRDYPELGSRIGAMEAKLDILIPEIQASNKSLIQIITGNGHPENGVVFRLKTVENNLIITKEETQRVDDKRKNRIIQIWTFISSLAVVVVGDIIHRTFFHHTKT